MCFFQFRNASIYYPVIEMVNLFVLEIVSKDGFDKLRRANKINQAL